VTDKQLAGRVVVITGANIGIGRAVADSPAGPGAPLRQLGRAPAKDAAGAEAAKRRPGRQDAPPRACDLGQLASVRAAAAAVLARDEPLHLLINNAGVGGQRGLTADGFELHFGTNHLGHFVLTQALLPRLRASAPARIVHVASGTHRKAPGISWDALRQPTPSVSGMAEYAVSKLANVLYSAELARRLAGTDVTSYAVNPGRVASNIWQRIPWPVRSLFKLTMITTEEGARSTLHAALAPDVVSGRYYGKRSTEEAVSASARDAALAAELWARSEAWVAPPATP